jgi:hypothetical protein
MSACTRHMAGRERATALAHSNGHLLGGWGEEHDRVAWPAGPVSVACCARCGGRVYVDAHQCGGSTLALTCAQAQHHHTHPDDFYDV